MFKSLKAMHLIPKSMVIGMNFTLCPRQLALNLYVPGGLRNFVLTEKNT